ncbi:hypothetical protein JYU20_00450 [Bacteroidales bacterium AH-315-I05]|nr:hypothetical protein [Bacteroidales bacterium AH-315-I05]
MAVISAKAQSLPTDSAEMTGNEPEMCQQKASNLQCRAERFTARADSLLIKLEQLKRMLGKKEEEIEPEY